MTRRLGRAAIVAAAALLGLAPALAPVAADHGQPLPSLTLVGAATYDVLPEEGRVAVTVRLTATNHLKNTPTKRFFFRTAVLTVLPGTSGFRLTAGSGSPKVAVGKRTETYTNLRLDFGANLAAGKSRTMTLTFDLKDPGGAPDRAVRISSSLVSFPAWAYATANTSGSSVEVRLPTGYDVRIGRGPLNGPVPDGLEHERWESGPLDVPLEFVADVVASRPVDYAETEHEVALANGVAKILLRSWPDDAAWRDRVAGLVARAVPVLEREIGVPWPVDGPLAVEEALVQTTGGYAGLYAPAERRIEIAYSASDGVVLHELAHAWFNGGLVADRWVAEGFASHYAALAAAELGVEPDAPAPPPDPDAGGIPLNDWGPAGSESAAAEQYAYAASLDVADEIASRAGDASLREVWARAAGGIGAYQPVVVGADGSVQPAAGAGTEPAEGPPDWRGLLDLLEDGTGKEFADLWRDLVARPDDTVALDARAAAREAYARTVQAAGEWRLPPATRAALRAWQFDVALQLLRETDAVIAQRDALAAAADAAGLRLPDRLRTAFEGNAGIGVAADEARAEQAVVDAVVHAREAEPRETGIGERLIIDIGLLGIDPAANLAAAADQLAAGDIQAAYASALQAETAWTAAPRVGRSRIVSTTLLVIALLLLVGLFRQQRRREAAAARPGDAAAS